MAERKTWMPENTPEGIVNRLVVTEAWQQEDRREVAQPALMGALNESLDRAFDLGARRAVQALRTAGMLVEK